MIKDNLIMELKAESESTVKMLEKVPLDNPSWKPHEKSMTIGRLATHVADNLLWVPRIVLHDSFDFATASFKPHVAASTEELLSIFKERLHEAIKVLDTANDEILN